MRSGWSLQASGWCSGEAGKGGGVGEATVSLTALWNFTEEGTEPSDALLALLCHQETLVLCCLMLPRFDENEKSLGSRRLCLDFCAFFLSPLNPNHGPQPGPAQSWCLTNICGLEDAGQDFRSVKSIFFHDHSPSFALRQPSPRGSWRLCF